MVLHYWKFYHTQYKSRIANEKATENHHVGGLIFRNTNKNSVHLCLVIRAVQVPGKSKPSLARFFKPSRAGYPNEPSGSDRTKYLNFSKQPERNRAAWKVSERAVRKPGGLERNERSEWRSSRPLVSFQATRFSYGPLAYFSSRPVSFELLGKIQVLGSIRAARFLRVPGSAWKPSPGLVRISSYPNIQVLVQLYS